METSSPVRPTRVGQIAVNVRDLPRAVSFYRDVLELKFLFEIPRAAFFEVGDLRIMLSLPERPEFDHAASIIYYDVPSIETAFRSLRDRGVVFEDEPHLIAKMPDHDLWMAFFHDTEGNFLALMSEVRSPTRQVGF